MAAAGTLHGAITDLSQESSTAGNANSSQHVIICVTLISVVCCPGPCSMLLSQSSLSMLTYFLNELNMSDPPPPPPPPSVTDYIQHPPHRSRLAFSTLPLRRLGAVVCARLGVCVLDSLARTQISLYSTPCVRAGIIVFHTCIVVFDTPRLVILHSHSIETASAGFALTALMGGGGGRRGRTGRRRLGVHGRGLCSR